MSSIEEKENITPAQDNPFEKRRQVLLAYKENRERVRRTSRMGTRLREILDQESMTELWADLETTDPLHFPGYGDKLSENESRTGSRDALVCASGTIGGMPVICCELSAGFLMGSMGTVVGEKAALAAEEADRRKHPLIIISASGGARMQEGMFSLLQMEKTSAAIGRFRRRGGLYISILTDPTTGGVSASFASLGDIILAEPEALIGFAGPRVISQTIHQKLPKGFQRAAFQLQHGFVDRIVPEEEMREQLITLLRLHRKEDTGLDTEDGSLDTGDGGRNTEGSREEESSSCKVSAEKAESEAEEVSAYDRLKIVRSPERPRIRDFIDALFEDFTELDGDRLGIEDPAILGGIASFEGRPVTVIGHRKDKDLRENIRCNFGMPGPGGYRKALRLMRQAEKFNRPVITFVDTPGAFPGKEAEENGISAAIAENLQAMAELQVPILSIVTGEGNSGGALGIGAGNRILMLENAVYSVLSPEGFASILWKDGKRVKDACTVMKMTAGELYCQGLIDGVIPEPEGGIQTDFEKGSGEIRKAIRKFIGDFSGVPGQQLAEMRYRKYRHFEGAFAPFRAGHAERKEVR